jgi:hypothetical protein
MKIAASSRLKSSKLPADCKSLEVISLRREEECGERKKSSWGGDVRWGCRRWSALGGMADYISQNSTYIMANSNINHNELQFRLFFFFALVSF